MIGAIVGGTVLAVNAAAIGYLYLRQQTCSDALTGAAKRLNVHEARIEALESEPVYVPRVMSKDEVAEMEAAQFSVSRKPQRVPWSMRNREIRERERSKRTGGDYGSLGVEEA